MKTELSNLDYGDLFILNGKRYVYIVPEILLKKVYDRNSLRDYTDEEAVNAVLLEGGELCEIDVDLEVEKCNSKT